MGDEPGRPLWGAPRSWRILKLGIEVGNDLPRHVPEAGRAAKGCEDILATCGRLPRSTVGRTEMFFASFCYWSSDVDVYHVVGVKQPTLKDRRQLSRTAAGGCTGLYCDRDCASGEAFVGGFALAFAIDDWPRSPWRKLC